jgi:hypothetical protein
MSLMKNDEIPVLLVAAGKKIDNISHVIKNLSEHGNFRIFYVICPRKDLDRALAHSDSIDKEVNVINEEDILPGLSLPEVRMHLKLSLPNWPENHLPGWYLQQFLKMGFSLYASNYSHYLIWDCDTLLTRSIPFFESDKILLTQGNEYHGEYFDTIRVLFRGIITQSVSHISQHLMVRTADMADIIKTLETPDIKWWKNILLSLNGKTPFQFSEYETYANYCLFVKSDAYKSKRRRWFRYGRSYFGCNLTQAKTSNLSNLFDFVAFEEWDSGLLKVCRSHLIVMASRLYLAFKKA